MGDELKRNRLSWVMMIPIIMVLCIGVLSWTAIAYHAYRDGQYWVLVGVGVFVWFVISCWYFDD